MLSSLRSRGKVARISTRRSSTGTVAHQGDQRRSTGLGKESGGHKKTADSPGWLSGRPLQVLLPLAENISILTLISAESIADFDKTDPPHGGMSGCSATRRPQFRASVWVAMRGRLGQCNERAKYCEVGRVGREVYRSWPTFEHFAQQVVIGQWRWAHRAETGRGRDAVRSTEGETRHSALSIPAAG